MQTDYDGNVNTVDTSKFMRCEHCEYWMVHPCDETVGWCDNPDPDVENEYTNSKSGCWWFDR